MRYRTFLLSRETLLTAANALLLLVGFLLSISGMPGQGRWLYLASALVGGLPLFFFAAKGLLLHRDLTAGVMVSTAMIAAIIVGEYSAAAIVVLMMAAGEWLENLTVARANNALRDLAQLVPPTVTVRRDGHEVEVPLSQVVIGDVVPVRSGERIGVDGVIVQGNGTVNQAAITGESLPVERKEGDPVLAGTLNEVGALDVRVTGVGDETTLGQIVKLVREAQSSPAPAQRLANRYAQYLVPLAFSIAIAVYLLTADIMRSITVLVVICPCSLVLATPTAIVAAIGNAAKRGILVKSGASMERIGRVDVVALDKTGTLTHGLPSLNAIVPLNDMDPQWLLQLGASAERRSEHPLGQALVRAARERRLRLSETMSFEALPGLGIAATVDGHKVIAGSRALMAQRSIVWPAEADARTRDLEEQGCTVIPIAVDGQVEGLLGLVDQPREQAQPTIAELKRLGVAEVIMITGDNPRVAAAIAQRLGVDRYFADVLPQDKLRIIRELQQAGRVVAFVGDGVNDAPALAAADVGIAMGVAGTDVANETAAICLLADEIERVPQVIALSRRAITTIRGNVVFSMSVNLLSVLLGSLGIIGPVFGALMHEFSAVPVIANSARLIGYRMPQRE